MEFDTLGLHCQHSSCNQKDFLPFTCQKCGKSLCFLHRSEFAHECEKKDVRDMISMDCPICKKSFKLSRADDPNEAWEQHFSTTCTKQPGSVKPSQRCAGPSCGNTLGPSNRFQCPKCHLTVCLSCRTPEGHECSSLRKSSNPAMEARLTRFSKGVTNDVPNLKGASRSETSTRDKSVSTKNRSNTDRSNTLKGSAQRRMHDNQQQQKRLHEISSPTSLSAGVVPPSANTVERFDCPLCSLCYCSSHELLQHVASAHPEVESSVPVPSQTNDSGVGGEVCPTCSRRFPDLMSLIEHAEREHSGISQREQMGKDEKCRVC